MTETHEFNAATVKEAVKKASEALDIPEESLSYEILDTGSAGFLGMGSRDARIAVTTEAESSLAVATTTESATENDYQEPSPDTADEPVSAEPVDVEIETEAEELSEQPPAPEGLLEDIERLTSAVVDNMGFDARIDVYDASEFIALNVTTGETGLFIGQKGETIDALQYLLNVAIYKDRDYFKRVIVDSEGYRQRRVEAVQGMAHRMARKAVRERRLVELPAMNTSERRVVHMFLKDNPQVTTTSQGTGDNRRVTVSPVT